MAEFKSWRSYWDFAQATKRRRRYVREPEVEAFLAAVLETAQKRVETILPGAYFWRAQLGHDWQPVDYEDSGSDEIPAPYHAARMKPLGDRAIEGRTNPKGIPYLYVATSRETALAEVRPWVGSFISVGQFKTLRQLQLMNCTSDRRGFLIYLEREPPPEKREEAVWVDIDRAFAAPVSLSDDIADYVPTQIIAELFRAHGFDGVAYRSSLGPGHNVALFDLDSADLVNCFLYEVKSIKFEFEETANPYFVRKYSETKVADPEGT